MPLSIGHEAASELAADLIEVDARPLAAAQRADVVAFVGDRIALAPAHLRMGMVVPSLLVVAALAVLPVDRHRAVSWLGRTRAPVLCDAVKALRALAIVRVYAERR